LRQQGPPILEIPPGPAPMSQAVGNRLELITLPIHEYESGNVRRRSLVVNPVVVSQYTLRGAVLAR
jgi:hypothetical protein